MVEAAGQLFRLFQGGLDYAFILSPGCGACYPAEFRLDPSSRSRNLRSGSMSLYRASLRLALFLPLGVAMPPRGGAGFADVSPVVTLPFRAEATVLIEPASASPTQPGTTCLARSFGSRLAPAGRQADARPVASTDPCGQATQPRGEADVNGAAPLSKLDLRLATPRPSPSAS